MKESIRNLFKRSTDKNGFDKLSEETKESILLQKKDSCDFKIASAVQNDPDMLDISKQIEDNEQEALKYLNALDILYEARESIYSELMDKYSEIHGMSQEETLELEKYVMNKTRKAYELMKRQREMGRELWPPPFHYDEK